MSLNAELCEAVNALADVIEADRELPAMQRHRDAKLAKHFRKVERISRARFRAQKLAVIKKADLHLKPFAAREATAETDEERKARIIASATAQLGPLIYGVPVSAADDVAFAGTVRAAINAGASGVEQSMSVTAADTESFVSRYLKDNGFTKLTGELDKTTVDRLARAIADAFEKGADYDGIVSAVKSEFADFTTARAKMIAQTELNDAFNASMLKFGEEAGATVKYWDTDLAPCPICLENEMASPIPIGDLFPSGASQPTEHPRCACSLRVGVEI